MSVTRITLSNHLDYVAVVPYLLGFQPSDFSLVSLAVSGDEPSRLTLGARYDLPASSADYPDLATHHIQMLQRHAVAATVLLAYGPGEIVTPAVDAFITALERAEITVVDALRVHHSCYHSYTCFDPECCPPEGVAFDPSTSAAAAVSAGRVIFPDRDSAAAVLDPIDGGRREEMTRATRRACTQARTLDASVQPTYWFTEGVDRVRKALASPDELTTNDAAWLAVLLTAPLVRDAASGLIDPHDLDRHRRLWLAMTRLVDPAFAAAPTCLLAMTAYLSGETMLATFAVERVLAADPDCKLARLLQVALAEAVPPDRLRSAWNNLIPTITFQAETMPERARPVLPSGW